ncbi:MAG: hypothetical protein EBS53_10680, partial [Bacteroidetes bacterium]|nr:hypothetical protein [Bacteroidota bacterium]
MISRSSIDQIMETVRLEEVIGEFVTLKKKGTNWVGNCPFHQEKTPSFVVTPAKNLYKSHDWLKGKGGYFMLGRLCVEVHAPGR